MSREVDRVRQANSFDLVCALETHANACECWP